MIKNTKAFITGGLILLGVILFLFATSQLNKDEDHQQKMEAAILHNHARDRVEDSLKLEKQQAAKMADYIRKLKELEEDLQEKLLQQASLK